MHQPIIAFDFSMNKPAMCCLIDNTIEFFIWPAKLDKHALAKLTDCGIHVKVRELDAMSDDKYDECTLICEHVTRAAALADMIIESIKRVLSEHCVSNSDYANIIIANEGFAFGAKGDAVLDLSGYKYVLMLKLYDAGFRKFKTYSPFTLKATAGCSKKDCRGKENMILMLGKEPTGLHTFIDIIGGSPELLRKKVNFITGVDDIADAYWCMKTVVKKEKINCIVACQSDLK